LFLVAKFIGHKQIAQFDFFDYITGITIGSIAVEMATELEEPWKPLTPQVIARLHLFYQHKTAQKRFAGSRAENGKLRNCSGADRVRSSIS